MVHKDTHGAVLAAGDTVTLIKDLKVKGANFTAKRGTAVRNISLVADNASQIEGRVNDQRIVILTEFVKKADQLVSKLINMPRKSAYAASRKT